MNLFALVCIISIGTALFATAYAFDAVQRVMLQQEREREYWLRMIAQYMLEYEDAHAEQNCKVTYNTEDGTDA